MTTMASPYALRGFVLAGFLTLAGAVAPAAFAQPAPTQPAPAQPPQSSGRLTTHVLDTLSGKPASGVRITFAVPDGEGWRTVKTLTTNADGRTNEPLLTGETMAVGRYRIVFEVGE